MKSYAQLKDGVVFSVHTSENNVDDSGPDVWLVETEDLNSLLGKKYENGSYVDAPKIKYAAVEEGTVVEIYETVFSSEVNGPIVTSDEVGLFWTFDGTNFNPPLPIIEDVISFDDPEKRIFVSNEPYASEN